MKQRVTNWGRAPAVEADLLRTDGDDEARARLDRYAPGIARGLGRCYGDSALAPVIYDMRGMDRLRSFDPERGLLVCEAGVSLEDILRTFVPRGWFLPVTPGTKFVTVGGAIAADVHGKNHHVDGGFGRHVEFLELVRPDGEIVRCSAREHAELFETTIGGMGLTGIILRAGIRLRKIETSFIREETLPFDRLDGILDCFEESADWTYSVAWIDCLSRGERMGRSVMMRGEHAALDELPPGPRRRPLAPENRFKLTVPMTLPSAALNAWTVRAFNETIYRSYRRRSHIVSYDAFFYPLDRIHHWNRIYGPRGFTQYQFVLPRDAGREGLRAILARIAEQGGGSFLAVLKLFGKQDGLLSFPMEGYTLALDFPVRPSLFPLLDALDVMVLDYGGRLYLAKDMRMSPETFRRGYPNAEEFIRRVHRFDPEHRLRSRQSDRLEVTR